MDLEKEKVSKVSRNEEREKRCGLCDRLFFVLDLSNKQVEIKCPRCHIEKTYPLEILTKECEGAAK